MSQYEFRHFRAGEPNHSFTVHYFDARCGTEALNIARGMFQRMSPRRKLVKKRLDGRERVEYRLTLDHWNLYRVTP